MGDEFLTAIHGRSATRLGLNPTQECGIMNVRYKVYPNVP